MIREARSTGMTVLVTDASQRVALAVARALAAAGADVWAAERRGVPAPMTFYSRHCLRRLRFSGPVGEGLLGLVRETHPDRILPISTNTVHEVLTHRREFEKELGMALPLPGMDLFLQANDKYDVIARVTAAGGNCPETHLVDHEEELARASANTGFPAVLKLRNDIGLFLPPGARYRIVRNPDALAAGFRELAAVRRPVVLQRYVEGDGYGYGAVVSAGNVLADFMHRRIHEHPLEGGPSALAESVNDPALREAGRRILGTLGWDGPAMVEFRRNRRDGRFYFIELNPRFWGMLPLATRCGTNLPAVLAGLPSADPAVEVPAGVKMKFAAMEIARAATLLRRGRVGEAIGAMATAGNPFLADGVFRVTDPLPAAAGFRAFLGRFGTV
ncbi:MAG: hypothetical protein V1809_09520 [Planctomycetota bacterium]